MRFTPALERTRRLHAARAALDHAYAALDEADTEYQLARRSHDPLRLAVAADRLYSATEAVYSVFRNSVIELSTLADRPHF